MLPIFAAIGAALATAVPFAKAAVMGALGGAATFGTTVALDAATRQSAAPMPAADGTPEKTPEATVNSRVPAPSFKPAWSALQNSPPEHTRPATRSTLTPIAQHTPLAPAPEVPSQDAERYAAKPFVPASIPAPAVAHLSPITRL